VFAAARPVRGKETSVKEGIHPQWHPEARVVCACGNTFTVGATVAEIQTEVCSACHPFFTGEQRIVDTAGQVERFMKRLEAGVDQRQAAVDRRDRKRDQELDAKRRRRGLTPLQAQRAARKPVITDEDDEKGKEGASADTGQ
jgi:large subunit ribosomal protein L31